MSHEVLLHSTHSRSVTVRIPGTGWKVSVGSTRHDNGAWLDPMAHVMPENGGVMPGFLEAWWPGLRAAVDEAFAAYRAEFGGK